MKKKNKKTKPPIGPMCAQIFVWTYAFTSLRRCLILNAKF